MKDIIIYAILFLVAVIPIIILGYYVNKYDQNKEPIKILIRLFIYGCIIVVPCFFLEVNLVTILDLARLTPGLTFFLSNFIVIALSEELWKWFAFTLGGYNISDFDEVYDGLLYGAFVSLGFACVENIAYVFNYGIETGLARAFLAVPSHVCNGVIMGYFLSKAKKMQKKGDKKRELLYLVVALIVPTILHGLYDLLASIETGFAYMFLAIMVVTIIIISKNMINNISKKKEAI